MGTSSERWKKLLYLTEDNLDYVRSDRFYFEGVRDPYYQFYRFKDYLADDGLPCKFPARYLYHNEEVTADKLISKCEELRAFYSLFRKKYLSLAHAEEYIGAPSSVFGHLYLVMHENEIPGPDAMSVSFNAVIDQESSLVRYLIRGVAGGFKGEFVGDLLLKKEYEYLYREQRRISYYEVEISERQYDKLIFTLFELRGIQFDYYFFTKNCAYQIDYLLSLVLEQSRPQPFMYSLPKDVVTKFRNNIKKEVVISPLEVVLERELILKGHLTEDFNRDVAQYKFLTGKSLTKDDLNSFRSTKSQFYKKNSEILLEDEQLIGPKRLNLKVINSKVVGISFTPLLNYLDTVSKGSVSSFTMGKVHAEVDLKNQRTYLSEINLVDLKSFPDFNFLTRKISWNFSFGVKRESRTSRLIQSTALGLGLSKNISGFTAGFTLGPELSLKFPGSKTNYLANFIVHRDFLRNTVLSFTAERNLSVSSMSSYRFSMTRFLNNKYALGASYERKKVQEDKEFTLSLSTFF